MLEGGMWVYCYEATTTRRWNGTCYFQVLVTEVLPSTRTIWHGNGPYLFTRFRDPSTGVCHPTTSLAFSGVLVNMFRSAITKLGF